MIADTGEVFQTPGRIKMKRSIIMSLVLTMLMLMSISTSALAGKASKRLLTPNNHILILLDHQPQMAFAVNSIDIQTLRNNVTGLAKSAALFNQDPTSLKIWRSN